MVVMKKTTMRLIIINRKIRMYVQSVKEHMKDHSHLKTQMAKT